ncbi:potassium-tellurite ethidium and proflavin transporter [uncultured Clostridium sp.]|uniref:TDT family transporter n=1 Tax=uncultured Clostridium sp. TaxID=59620 RepID=UPI0008216003|nr:TDT family transporter [uncultured Clostridium sp.]SCI87886.1 potassium-tellurite ethidium and proflavin transporter [uncultured Clostridium sp.]
MNNKSFLQKLENLPVAILPTMVGALTLGTVYANMGYTWIKHITSWTAVVILLVYLTKIIFHFDTVKKEYSNTVPASLYAGFTMITMILGSYFYNASPVFGKTLWFTGLILHAIHILVFTYRNVVKGVNMQTFVPSWFVTYNGIMVSTVVGGVMNEPLIGKIVVFYGIAVLTVIMPFMLYRLAKHEIKDPVFHTQAILLAPSSLCLVSYFNFIKEPNAIIVYYLYALVIAAFLFILWRLPRFFSFDFHPGFAGLTFPMAIGIVASTKMSGYLIAQGYETAGNIVNQLAGIQTYVTTMLIGYILLRFFMLFKDSYKKSNEEKAA